MNPCTDPASAIEWPTDSDWSPHLASCRESNEMVALEQFVRDRRQQGKVFPASQLVFRALQLTPLGSVQFVILGQDPYHDVGQAHGLSFSVPAGTRIPPSLRNIFRELTDDSGVSLPAAGDLTAWALRGGLLLNTVLTVDAHHPHSHRNRGWETLTDRIISLVSRTQNCVAFVLWGNAARQKKHLIDENRHLVIESAHPSPLSAHRGFFGSRPFSRINQYREHHHLPAVDWSLADG